ncbi:MAG: hypothetical protein AB7O24_32260 [Kofleriaceae bacterium]
MISTLRGLIIAAGLVVVLAVIAIVGQPAGRPPLARSLVPGFVADAVTELRWQRPGQPELAIVRDGAMWRWAAPATAVADSQTVSDVLGALRGSVWQRRAPIAQAGQLRSQLTIVAGGTATTIGIAGPLEGTEQAWLIVGEHAVLVDRWVVRALDPAPLALRIRRPLEAASSANRIAVLAAELTGHPRRLVRGDARYLVSAESARSLEAALSELEITEPVTTAAAAGPELTIELDKLTATLAPGCNDKPELYRLATPSGDGCVASHRVAAIRTAVDGLAPELRPAPIDVAKLTLPDGAVVDVRARPMIGDAEADVAQVAQLLAVLAAPATLVERAPEPMRATLHAADAAGASITLELIGRDVIRRAGESIALRITLEAMAILERPAAALRNPVLWVEDPTTLTAIAIDDTTYTRGAVLGEWTSTPSRAFAAADVTALAALLAAPRAVNAARKPPPVSRHRVVITVSAPSGPPKHHTIELGDVTAAGCRARVDGQLVVLALEICRGVDAVVR